MSKRIEQQIATSDDPTLTHICYRYDVKRERLDDPEQISPSGLLPSGLSARFIRADHWKATTP